MRMPFWTVLVPCLALASRAWAGDPLAGSGPKFESGKQSGSPGVTGKAIGPSGGSGASGASGLTPIGPQASSTYNDALWAKIKENILSDRIMSDARPCKRYAAILYFINEKVDWTDDSGAKKSAPPFKMDKATLESMVDKVKPNVETFFVSMAYKAACVNTPGIALAAGMTSERKKVFSSSEVSADCRRSVGDPKKDAILIFNAPGAEKDSASNDVTPVANFGIEAAHEYLHLFLPIIKTKEIKAHHGLTNYISYGRAAPTNAINWAPASIEACKKYE